MTVKSAVHALSGVAVVLALTTQPALAHEIVGVENYYLCQPNLARAFLRSPNPGNSVDFPLDVVDAEGHLTSERILVITVENVSLFDGRLNALGFTWGDGADRFELVQLNRSYNDLTTRDATGVRKGTAGPADYEVVRSLAISQSHGDVEFSVRQDIAGVPGFPHTRLGVALVTGNTFSGGPPRSGLATDGIRHVIAIKGVLPPGLNIERLLNDAYVRFRQVGADGEGSDTGIWRNLLPAISCP